MVKKVIQLWLPLTLLVAAAAGCASAPPMPADTGDDAARGLRDRPVGYPCGPGLEEPRALC